MENETQPDILNSHSPRLSIEEHLEVDKCRSLIVSLVMVLVVRLVCQATAVCTSYVLPTRGTLQYV